MGQKRIQNIIDENVGTYLADFEREVLTKMAQKMGERRQIIDASNERLTKAADRAEQTIQRTEQAANYVNQSVEHFATYISLYIFGAALTGGVIGGLVMFLLMWYAW